MIKLRKSNSRGQAHHGWLQALHSFSFGSYYDPDHLGFRSLMVINEDQISAGAGFGKHGHSDMEIITYVLSGALEHKDSLGTGSVLRHGQIQRMSAGRGVQHSEFNASKTDPLHLLQIWISPAQKGIPPSYEEKDFELAQNRNRLLKIAAPDADQGALKIHQDASIYVGLFDSDQSTQLVLAPSRFAWVQVARGSLELNGLRLEEGDGASVSETENLEFKSREPVEFLVFDLP